ncbi:MAG: hypothetical protein IJ193_04535 [Bacilli bacterium]|nr:hypothetical protein [Bacilli bacterium]
MSEIRFVSPLYDTTFKWLWKKEKSREFFIKLIRYITTIDLHDYELYDPELNTGNKIKDYRMDLLFLSNIKDKSVNVEMYKEYHESDPVKSFQYAFRILSEKMKEGEKYHKQELIQVNLYNTSYKENKDVRIIQYQIQNETGEYGVDYLKVYDVYLSKFKDSCYNKADELDAMLSLLNCNSYEEMRHIANGNKEALDIVEDLEDLAMQEKFIGVYDNEKEQRILQNTYYFDGRVEGHEEGRKEGKREEKIEIARNLLENDVEVEIIMKSTGLSLEEINNL